MQISDSCGKPLHVSAEQHAIGVRGRFLNVHRAADQAQPHSYAGKTVGIGKNRVTEFGAELRLPPVRNPGSMRGSREKSKKQRQNDKRIPMLINTPYL